MLLYILFLFLFGLILGSFLNAFLYRYNINKSLWGRSFCPACKHQINWYDNIPLISWLMLSGKCRYCKKPISYQYPAVELLTGIGFVLVGLFSLPGLELRNIFTNLILGNNLNNSSFIINSILLLLLFLITLTLITISVYDLKNKEIPNGFNLTFLTFSISYFIGMNIHTKIPLTGYFPYLLAAIFGFLFFYSLVYISNETWMGGGDAKLAFGMGFLLGPIGLFIAFFGASILGSVIGITILLKEKTQKKKVSHEIPFGPFLALGTFIAMLFSSQIASWYVNIFLGV